MDWEKKGVSRSPYMSSTDESANGGGGICARGLHTHARTNAAVAWAGSNKKRRQAGDDDNEEKANGGDDDDDGA